MGYRMEIKGVRVLGVRRGAVTLSDGPGDEPMTMLVGGEEYERQFARLMADDDEGGTLVVKYLYPGETEAEHDAASAHNLAAKEAEIGRLKALVKALEESKGALSCRVERPSERCEAWVFTCPNGNEEKIAMMMAAMFAMHDFNGVQKSVKMLARALGRDDANDPKVWAAVLDEMSPKASAAEVTAGGAAEEWDGDIACPKCGSRRCGPDSDDTQHWSCGRCQETFPVEDGKAAAKQRPDPEGEAP